MFISTFGIIRGLCYVTLLSISLAKTVTIRGSRAETFGLYLRANNIQTTRFCIPVDSLYITYTLFYVILVIHINVEVTVNERLLNVSNVHGNRLWKERFYATPSAPVPSSKGNHFSGGAKYTGVAGIFFDLQPKSQFISETARDRSMVAMER